MDDRVGWEEGSGKQGSKSYVPVSTRAMPEVSWGRHISCRDSYLLSPLSACLPLPCTLRDLTTRAPALTHLPRAGTFLYDNNGNHKLRHESPCDSTIYDLSPLGRRGGGAGDGRSLNGAPGVWHQPTPCSSATTMSTLRGFKLLKKDTIDRRDDGRRERCESSRSGRPRHLASSAKRPQLHRQAYHTVQPK